MEFVLRDIPGIKIYADDILVSSKGKQQHLQILQKILQLCAQYGIKIAPDKCHLLQQEVTFLGFKLSANNIQPEEDKITRMKDLQPPSTKKEVSSVLGLFNFFGKFLPNFAKQSVQLSALTRTNHTWRGENYFQDLRMPFII